MKFIAGILAALAFSSSAHAGMLGNTITFSQTWIGGGSSTQLLVSNDVEFYYSIRSWSKYASIDIGDDYIEIRKNVGVAFNEGSALIFSDLGFGNIGNIQISSNFDVWDNSNVSYQHDLVKISFKEDTGNSAANAFLRLKLIAAVPEPSTYAMLGLGLGLIGFTARRRKSA